MLSRPRARTMHGPGSPASWATRHTPPPTCRLTCRQFTLDQLSATEIHQLQPRPSQLTFWSDAGS